MNSQPSDPTRPLTGKIALVAGGTRGAGRGIAHELGAAGATVYVTGRTTAASSSPMQRPETIEATAALVSDAGGVGIPRRVDHLEVDEVAALASEIQTEHGHLDILINDVWGGDHRVDWESPFWQQDLDKGRSLLHDSIDTHLITSMQLAPLLIAGDDALLVEVTDGMSARYRGSIFYDLIKSTMIRLAVAQAAELGPHGVTVVAVSPGFLRSEAMLDHFGVTAETWRDGIADDEHFAQSETPRYVGRAMVALAADPDRADLHGTATASWELMHRYGFTDVDGSQPDWGTYARTVLDLEP